MEKKLEKAYNTRGGKSPVTCIDWTADGKSFLCGHKDGHVSRWNWKTDGKPEEIVGEPNDDPFAEPVTKLAAWGAGGAACLAHNGGPAPLDGGSYPLTVTQSGTSRRETTFFVRADAPLGASPGNKCAVPSHRDARARARHFSKALPLLTPPGPRAQASDVLDMQFITGSQWQHESDPPKALAVLLQDQLRLIDLTKPGLRPVTHAHGLALHDSPVSCTLRCASCDPALITAVRWAGRKQEDAALPRWPIGGGSAASGGHDLLSHLVFTGHADGRVRVWEVKHGVLTIACTIAAPPQEVRAVFPHEGRAVQTIEFCPGSRRLAVSHFNGAVCVYRFDTRRHEVSVRVHEVAMKVPVLPSAAKEGAAAEPAAASIKSMMEHGFEEEKCRAELAKCHGDANAALANLFSADLMGDSYRDHEIAVDAATPAQGTEQAPADAPATHAAAAPAASLLDSPPAYSASTSFSMQALPGFQLVAVACATLECGGERERVQHATCMSMSTGEWTVAFGNAHGVCVLSVDADHVIGQVRRRFCGGLQPCWSPLLLALDPTGTVLAGSHPVSRGELMAVLGRVSTSCSSRQRLRRKSGLMPVPSPST